MNESLTGEANEMDCALPDRSGISQFNILGLSLVKTLSGVNAFEISNIQRRGN